MTNYLLIALLATSWGTMTIVELAWTVFLGLSTPYAVRFLRNRLANHRAALGDRAPSRGKLVVTGGGVELARGLLTMNLLLLAVGVVAAMSPTGHAIARITSITGLLLFAAVFSWTVWRTDRSAKELMQDKYYRDAPPDSRAIPPDAPPRAEEGNAGYLAGRG